jgi:hypothetical protein
MVRQINEFSLAWASLADVSQDQGWRSIPVTHAGHCNLMAGIRFPANEESLLTYFPTVRVPVAEQLPEGLGFTVERVDPYCDGKTWLALTRKESGSVELFSTMVFDVVAAMDAEASSNAERLLRVFLGRVRAWQEFMRKGAQSLGPEAEIGLIGELFILQKIIDADVPLASVLESWVGPVDGIQDFEIGTGAIEVKATISHKGFLAKIGSLDQLDDSLRQPLFLAGVRFTQTETGLNLPEFVETVRNSIKDDAEADRMFKEKLLAVGYFDSQVDRYSRRFICSEMRVLEVAEGFPRITLGTVPDGIKRVVYDIDLDRVLGENHELLGILRRLGAL